MVAFTNRFKIYFFRGDGMKQKDDLEIIKILLVIIGLIFQKLMTTL